MPSKFLFGRRISYPPRMPGWSISTSVVATAAMSTSASTFEQFAQDDRSFDYFELFDYLGWFYVRIFKTSKIAKKLNLFSVDSSLGK